MRKLSVVSLFSLALLSCASDPAPSPEQDALRGSVWRALSPPKSVGLIYTFDETGGYTIQEVIALPALAARLRAHGWRLQVEVQEGDYELRDGTLLLRPRRSSCAELKKFAGYAPGKGAFNTWYGYSWSPEKDYFEVTRGADTSLLQRVSWPWVGVAEVQFGCFQAGVFSPHSIEDLPQQFDISDYMK